MSPDEKQIKKLLSETTPVTDEKKALALVLNKSSNVAAVKDVVSLFVGWFWVVLLGFGASAFSAKRRLEIHKQQKRQIDKNKN